MLAAAILISATSMYYTNQLVDDLQTEEKKRIELWAEATKQIQASDLLGDINILVYEILQTNTTIPVILTNNNDSVITFMNINEKIVKNNTDYLMQKLELLKSEHEPIVIIFGDNSRNLIYYGDSWLLTQLAYYPAIQLVVMFFFVWIAITAFSTVRHAEENRVWVGMSKETAHQLGTPISSLIAGMEYLQQKEVEPKIVNELNNDVERLEKIAHRFSKIGSEPELITTNLYKVLNQSIDYLKARSSAKISYYRNYNIDAILYIPMNQTLFEWVIENLCKNAIDSMEAFGEIKISTLELSDAVIIEIKDTGKGIPKSKFKTVFQPGYSTKKRGWGLGLSLTKRIVESYHKGLIFVKESSPEQGTTFRIVMPKSFSGLQFRKKLFGLYHRDDVNILR